MRGRGLALMAGVAVGRHAASQQAAAQQQQQAQAQPMQAAPAAPAAPAAAPPKDVTAELQKLADLHKSGVLTDEEFTAAKKKLLG
jgi:membrane protease subunit (stomatin/prohibitin family)